MIIKGIKRMCYMVQKEQLKIVLDNDDEKYIDMSVSEYEKMLRTGDFKKLEQYV